VSYTAHTGASYSKGWPITTATGLLKVPTNPAGGGGGGGGALVPALLAPLSGCCWPCGASTTTAYAVCTGCARPLKTCAVKPGGRQPQLGPARGLGWAVCSLGRERRAG